MNTHVTLVNPNHDAILRIHRAPKLDPNTGKLEYVDAQKSIVTVTQKPTHFHLIIGNGRKNKAKVISLDAEDIYRMYNKLMEAKENLPNISVAESDLYRNDDLPF